MLESFAMVRLNLSALKDTNKPVSKIAARLEPYLQMLIEEFEPEQIILFGSYAYGQPTEHSDVDLLVIKPLNHSSLHEALAIRKLWRPLTRSKDRLTIELLLQSPEQHEQRLAHNSGFYSEINTRGLRLA